MLIMSASWSGARPPGVEGVVKLFMTRSGGDRYSFPVGVLGRTILRWMSLQREYFFTPKWRVGPRGVRAMRRVVLPEEGLREKRRRWVTLRTPDIVV